MSTISIPGSTASSVNMPGFTAESALSIAVRDYRVPRLPRARRIMAASDVQVALTRGSGAGSNFWCDESAGTCSCLGGSLSEDCWLMQQYCTSPLQCSAYYPYRCDCYYTLVRPPTSIFTRPGGGVFHV